MHKLDLKLIALCVLLPLQLLLVIFYVLSTPSTLEYYTHNSRLLKTKSQENNNPGFFISKPNHQVTLNDSLVDKLYTPYHGINCNKHGTDIQNMEHFLEQIPKMCVCKRGWHGKDCGQPEVIWRAFMTSRQEIVPTKRKALRRIIYMCHVNYADTHGILLETIFHELDYVVDIFLVYETNSTRKGASIFPKQFRKKSYRPIRHKIVYMTLDVEKLYNNLWHSIQSLIPNLRQDDLVVMMNGDQIPNSKALLYFKLYDGWPQPVGFRLRWSVYGFFWQHPQMTNTALRSAFTVQFLEDVMRHKITKVSSDPAETRTQLIVGDLNHYGGWFCNLCFEPKDIITLLHSNPEEAKPINWDQIQRKKIDIHVIQDLIGNGLWLDSVTALVSKYQHKDAYFAPHYILNNSWQYDSLLTNFYAYDYN